MEANRVAIPVRFRVLLDKGHLFGFTHAKLPLQAYGDVSQE